MKVFELSVTFIVMILIILILTVGAIHELWGSTKWSLIAGLPLAAALIALYTYHKIKNLWYV